MEEDLTSASENIGKSKTALQKLAFFRDDVLDKKKTDAHAEMVLEVYEQRERGLNKYFDEVQKQYDRTSQFYKDVERFEAWYPKVEERLEVEEQLDNNPNNLRRILAEFEVLGLNLIVCFRAYDVPVACLTKNKGSGRRFYSAQSPEILLISSSLNLN